MYDLSQARPVEMDTDEVEFIVTLPPGDGQVDEQGKKKQSKKRRRKKGSSQGPQPEVIDLVEDDSAEEERMGKKPNKGQREAPEAAPSKAVSLLEEVFDPKGTTNGLQIVMCDSDAKWEGLLDCINQGEERSLKDGWCQVSSAECVSVGSCWPLPIILTARKEYSFPCAELPSKLKGLRKWVGKVAANNIAGLLMYKGQMVGGFIATGERAKEKGELRLPFMYIDYEAAPLGVHKAALLLFFALSLALGCEALVLEQSPTSEAARRWWEGLGATCSDEKKYWRVRFEAKEMGRSLREATRR
jgi:hypothetical protein